MKYNASVARKVSELLLSIGGMTFRFNPPFVYTTGLKSPVYLDNRLILSYPKVRNQIIDFYVQAIKEKIGVSNVDSISATATAAIPQGALVADRLHLPMVYVRPTTKAYGKGGKVEGILKKGSNMLIVEDHITTGTSVIGNAAAIRELGGKVQYCITTTIYETSKVYTMLKESNIDIIFLTTGKDIVDVAAQKKIISKKEKASIDLWFEDPPGWAKKVGLE